MNGENEAHLTSLYLTGPPGSGKTQLARQFGEKFLKDTPNDIDNRPVVLTINVESTKSLLKSTKDVLHQLKLVKADNTKESDEIKVVQLYMETLRNILIKYPGKWLLIFDNMFCDKDLKGILPQPGCENWGDGKIIITSQNSDLAPVCHEYAKTYTLKHGLEEKDAVNLLEKISGLKEDEFAVCLARELDFFPLSLACSATYVSQMITDRPSSNFSWKNFLELYRKHKGKLTFRAFEANVYPRSMDVAARLATNRLADYSNVLRHAFDFLSYCTISPVPLVIVSNFVQASLSCDAISDEIKAEISRCSLLSNSSSSFETVENIEFHQVMGHAFVGVREERAAAQKLDTEERRKEYASLLHSLRESLEKAIPDYDRISVSLKVLASPHLKSIINFGKAQQWTDCEEFVVILAFLADCLYHVPGVTEAERISYCELAHKIAHRLPKPMKSIRYCHVLKTLGFYYREANRFEEAVAVLEEAVAVIEEGLRLTHGEDSKEWIALKSSTLKVLSWTYKLQTKFDLAEQTMKESIHLAKISFRVNHQEVIERLCDLAIIYREKQDISKAKETADQARQMAEITTDEWHLTRAQAANYSAKIYLRYAEMIDNPEKKNELLNESLKLHSNALTIYENVLGKNHIYVAGVCMTYALVFKELNDLDRALELVERAEEIYQDVEHVQLSYALRCKTEVLLPLGKADDAENAIKRSIEIENCGRARFLLSNVYLQQKKYQESRAIIQEVLARWKSGVLPSTHIWVKQAEKIKQQCDRGILKTYIFRLLPVVVLLVSIFLGIWYRL
jgi:tetratricopeptide (TPR) repeat protein